MKKKLDITIGFDGPLPSGDRGEAKYGVQVFISKYGQQAQPQPTINLPAGQTCFNVEAEEGDTVAVLVAACDKYGVWSPATHHEFRARTSPHPPRPTNIHVAAVSIKDETPPAPAGMEEGENFLVNVTGHADLKDGAVGSLLEISQQDPTKSVLCGFAGSAFKHEVKSGEITLTAGQLYRVTVISQDQTTMPLEDFLKRRNEARNVSSEAAAN